MRLRAEIVIEMDANDFAEAAEHHDRVRRVFEAVRQTYEHAQLEFRQRRTRARRRANDPRRGMLHYTGRMSDYE